jgi:hypothetical protein
METGAAVNQKTTKHEIAGNGGQAGTTVYHLRSATDRLRGLINNWPPESQIHVEEMLVGAE